MNFLKKVKEFDSNSASARTFNYKKYIAELFLAIGIIALILIIPLSSKVYATEEFWTLNIGENTIAVLNSETEANEVIEKVKNNYVEDGAKDVEITIDPVMSVEQKFYHTDEAPTTMTVDEAVNYIITGTEETVSYTVKEGDTFWSISEDNNLTVEELQDMNKDKDTELIKPGDELNLTAMKSFVNVTTVQTVTSTKTIKYKTKYVKTDSLQKGTTKVKTEGKNGKKKVTETITTVNGEVIKTVELDSEVITKPTTKVVKKGTGTVTAAASSSSSPSYADSTTYAGSGQDIANYALQFVGNPYVYGGSSLTNGADCSGFVMAVYAHFGISLPHDAGADRSYGRGVSLSEAQPGDLVCYYGHVGIYIGGGRLVHAKDYGYGICVDSVHYSSNPIMTIRRIVE